MLMYAFHFHGIGKYATCSLPELYRPEWLPGFGRNGGAEPGAGLVQVDECRHGLAFVEGSAVIEHPSRKKGEQRKSKVLKASGLVMHYPRKVLIRRHL
jgi:hypothetical protein